jgi:hypothetical protein
MNNRTDDYEALRRRYPEFVYEDYHYEVNDEGLHIWFDFRMGEVVFHPEAMIEARPFLYLHTQGLDPLVFDIGMVELVSYWKSACPPTVRVLCGSLDENQVAFWKKLYWNGLGEFYYTNGITGHSDLTDITGLTPSPSPRGEGSGMCTDRTVSTPLSARRGAGGEAGWAGSEAFLVPIGGGKDSVVTLELLRRAGKTIRPLIMNPRGATRECARVAGFPLEEVLVIRRRIDPVLLDLNAKGYLNGHTPFSAMLAFYTRLASALSGIPNVALSNENSANEATVLGSTVNHQYSKSLEFEDDFREYCASMRPQDNKTTSSHSTINYFSFLRPLSELQIAMLFSRFTAYHDVFRSCNVGSKEDIWCGHCAKCLFAYIILSPFIEPKRLNAIFGKSMLDDLSLHHEFDQLIGNAETKPFECVGTVSEVRQALAMAIERWYPEQRPALLKDFVESNAPKVFKDFQNLKELSPIGNLTDEERNILQEACTEKNS